MKTLHESHALLCEIFRKYHYVSTPLLQHEYGIPFEEGTKMLRYARERGWISEEGCDSFHCDFLAAPLSRKKLTEDEIICYAELLTDTFLDLLLQHENEENGFSLEEAMSEQKKKTLPFSYMKEKKIAVELIQKGLIVLYDNVAVVNADHHSLLAIQNLKKS